MNMITAMMQLWSYGTASSLGEDNCINEIPLGNKNLESMSCS